MIMRFFIPVLVVSVSVAWGQSNSLTVTASRNTNLQPDQVVFNVYVDSGLDATREDALAAVQGAGITLANFSYVNTEQQYVATSQNPRLSLRWSFTLLAALSSMRSTIGLLSAVQTSVAKTNNGLAVSFSVQGTQVSPQLQQSQTCSVADLIADARAQGLKMASAAGMSLGAVLAMSGTTVTPPGGQPSPYAIPPVCSLTVKFALGAL